MSTALSPSPFRHEVVAALLRTYGAHDPETLAHVQRVGELAERVARQIGKSEAEAQLIGDAARLCDLGKIAVSDLILAKPDQLDEEEWGQMRRHPIVGAEIVEPISVLRPMAPAIRYHHERYDGRGYPAGLQGQDIPLEARLIAVCDAYDAMLRDRPFRPPLSPAQARRVLRREAGAQFDPALVEALLAVVEAEDQGSA